MKEAEKFVGAPAAQLLRVPRNDADEAAGIPCGRASGSPPDAKQYDFSDIKFTDGTADRRYGSPSQCAPLP